jgi:hypothetical protein
VRNIPLLQESLFLLILRSAFQYQLHDGRSGHEEEDPFYPQFADPLGKMNARVGTDEAPPHHGHSQTEVHCPVKTKNRCCGDSVDNVGDLHGGSALYESLPVNKDQDVEGKGAGKCPVKSSPQPHQETNDNDPGTYRLEIPAKM